MSLDNLRFFPIEGSPDANRAVVTAQREVSAVRRKRTLARQRYEVLVPEQLARVAVPQANPALAPRKDAGAVRGKGGKPNSLGVALQGESLLADLAVPD